MSENEPAQPPEGVGLAGLRSAAAGCRACELWEPATQTVFGEGPETARIVLVGEQPGDQEDRVGEPFVGPAGKLLDRALADAGIDRRDAYVTNAVKHFRFTPKGKRRIHQTPGPEHLRACRPWLEAEFAVLAPGDRRLPRRDRGQGAHLAVLPDHPGPRATPPLDPAGRGAEADDGHQEADDDEPDEGAPAQTWMLATTHPSAILRTPDEGRAAAYDALVADLAVVAHALA